MATICTASRQCVPITYHPTNIFKLLFEFDIVLLYCSLLLPTSGVFMGEAIGIIFSRIFPLHRYTMKGLVPPPTGLPPSPMTCPFATPRYATVANRRYTVVPTSGVRIIDVATLRQCHGVRTSNDMLQC